MISVVETAPGAEWEVTKAPSWLGRLFGRKAVTAVVHWHGLNKDHHACRSLHFKATARCIGHRNRWIADAIELRTVGKLVNVFEDEAKASP